MESPAVLFRIRFPNSRIRASIRRDGMYYPPTPSPLIQNAELASIPLNASARRFVCDSRIGGLFPSSLLPQILGIVVGRWFGLGPLYLALPWTFVQLPGGSGAGWACRLSDARGGRTRHGCWTVADVSVSVCFALSRCSRDLVRVALHRAVVFSEHTRKLGNMGTGVGRRCWRCALLGETRVRSDTACGCCPWTTSTG